MVALSLGDSGHHREVIAVRRVTAVFRYDTGVVHITKKTLFGRRNGGHDRA
jgi:hypothetical protein